MKFLILAAIVAFSSTSFAARTAIKCSEIDEKGESVNDGLKIDLYTSNKYEDTVESATISDPGHKDIDLEPSYFHFINRGEKHEVTFSSSMTYESTRNSMYTRIVTLNASLNTSHTKDAGKWLGVANVRLFDLKQVWNDPDQKATPVECSVSE